MLKYLVKTLGRPAYSHYRDLVTRVEALETGMRCLIKNPVYVAGDDVGFNGQHGRKEIFRRLASACQFDLILETGTFIGNTTGYMAQTTGLPVYTCERDNTLFVVAGQRLADISGVHRYHSDSRRFLDKMDPETTGTTFPFVYLDAHWGDDLPLAEELEILCRNWDRFVVMVDDFAVPTDTGYGFDDYGRGRQLGMRDFGSVFRKLGLVAFFPALKGAEETGGRRGCVVLAPRGSVADTVAQLEVLVQSGG